MFYLACTGKDVPPKTSRKWHVAVATLLLVMPCVLLIAHPPRAEANACGSVKVKHTHLSVGGDGVGCAFQRRWAQRFLRGGNEPNGWSCHRDSSLSGGCDKHRSSAFFVFYPED